MNTRTLRFRTGAIYGFFAAILIGFIITLCFTQLVHGGEYAVLHTTSRSAVPISAARGVILDRNGVPLVENRSKTAIIFEHPFFPIRTEKAERNALLQSLITLFEKHNTPWIDNLPILIDKNGKLLFAPNREVDIVTLKSKEKLNLNPNATVEDCMHALVERYALTDYSTEDARKIASVIYEMERQNYSTSAPYTFADDVGEALVSIILENSAFYRGVRSEVVPDRFYPDGTIAPHILGRVAAINAEDYAKHKGEGYKLNDEFGASGIERSEEAYLRGKDGEKVVTNQSGIVESEVVKEAQQGDTVILTIDKELQEMIQERFPKYLSESTKRYNVPPAGAVVVLDVRNFEILACVTTPSYDISTYTEDLTELMKDPETPLYDRALLGSYEPGSTIKPSVALAALQEGLITPTYTYRCTGTYHYLDSKYKCAQVGLHGGRPINVVKALVDSCNSFFYDLGRQLGYEQVNAYRMAMGLGQKTGVELPESSGVMDSPERRNKMDQQWYPGYNIQTAIGQNNLFTPIQIAVYTGTIANNGTRYRAHFVQSIRKAATNEVVKANTPTVLGTTGVDVAYYQSVKQAMYQLGTNPSSTAGRYFKNLPVEVAAKTGTSQVVRKIDGKDTLISNGIFISFAPFDNPEIAVIAVGEGCKSSEPTIPTVRDIYEYYFTGGSRVPPPQAENTLLG
ncbi:MAG: hypothetical protein LBB67_05625 [Oscillospiraceae bacterium]|jgi:penicillin-binding protein 2|nr:hypothetical protein [Oscillospiraceae bacterium]